MRNATPPLDVAPLLDELPDGRPGRRHSSRWDEPAILAKRNPGKWVPVTNAPAGMSLKWLRERYPEHTIERRDNVIYLRWDEPKDDES